MGLLRYLKQETVAILGEFVGTFLFLFIAFFATQTANASVNAGSTGPNIQSLLFISLAFGFSLAVNAWTFFRVSGGLFNPAVTLSLALIGAVKPLRSIGVFIAQILGGIAAAGVVKGLLPGHPTLQFKTTLTVGMTNVQGLFLEMFVTAQLVITILFLAAEKHKATFIAPVGIGLSLFIAELAAVYYTGGSLNPARSFGPCVVDADFPSYHWIYWIGPLLGSLLATAFYAINKSLDYEEAVPGQDKSLDPELSPAAADRGYGSRGQDMSQRKSAQGSGSRSTSQNRDSGYGQSGGAMHPARSDPRNSHYQQQSGQQYSEQQYYGQQYPPVAPQQYQQAPQRDFQPYPSQNPSRRRSRESSHGRQPRRHDIVHGTN